ncbi:glycerophosphodiester phosphodiesterase [Saccharomonospora viridis]|uniref:glycerophosphodiester phosphodiesterase n=1 Tax=Saccharomonospora viridis TaxID=1852 RepID=UPI0023F057BB|nr:glycerophosphodiester phosphodiesterase [Saccharomonospora viridis]
MAAVYPYLVDSPPRAFAHRGWHVGDLSGMENSLSAFRRAVVEGYRYVETDVHATADGTVVVSHDPTLDRTTDGTGPIAAQLWKTVRRAKIGGREPVSRLEDVLEELPETFFNVDIKSDAAVEPFVRTIRRLNAFDRVAAAAFSEARLVRVRKLAGPRLLTSLGPRSALLLRVDGWLPFLRLGSFSRGLMAQVPLRHGPVTVVDKAFIAAARRLGIEVHTWTINDKERMRQLLDLGVHGIVTDRPDLLREVLIERGGWPSAS